MYLVTLCYDGRPLNKGLFIRYEDGKMIIDGMRPKLSVEDVKNMKDIGKFMKGNARFILEIMEYYAYDVFGNLCLNVATEYSIRSSSKDDIKRKCPPSKESLRTCYNCLLNGHSCNLTEHDDLGACRKCEESNDTCISCKTTYTFSDMESSQRVAHMELNKDIKTTGYGPITITQGFGFSMLHIIKH